MGDDRPRVNRGHLRVAMLAFALIIGFAVAWETVGFYPSINHCPQAENLVCPSGNLKNVIPGVVGAIVTVGVLFPLLYAEAWYFETLH